MAEVEWDTDQLRVFARSLNADKTGRAVKKEMQANFDSVTEDLRDRLREGVRNLPGLGSYPADAAESMVFKTKLVGGKNARVSVVGEGKTAKGKWREFGKLLDEGVLYHPAWGYWRSAPPPDYLRQASPQGPLMKDRVVSQSAGPMRDEIRAILTDYLDRLTDIRKA